MINTINDVFLSLKCSCLPPLTHMCWIGRRRGKSDREEKIMTIEYLVYTPLLVTLISGLVIFYFRIEIKTGETVHMGSNPGIHMVACWYSWLQFQGIWHPLLVFSDTRHACGTQSAHTHIQTNTHTHEKPSLALTFAFYRWKPKMPEKGEGAVSVLGVWSWFQWQLCSFKDLLLSSWRRASIPFLHIHN